MSKKDYKVNEAIKVVYKAQTLVSQVDMLVFDEVDVLMTTVNMTQLGISKRWSGDFTPDAEGDWHVEVDDSGGGEVIKHFSIGSYNLQDIGADISTTEAKVDILDGKIDAINIQSPPMIG